MALSDLLLVRPLADLGMRAFSWGTPLIYAAFLIYAALGRTLVGRSFSPLRIGGAAVLGRSDIGSLEVGKCADFFTLDLNAIAYSGGLSDPVAAIVFCAPTSARHTVVGGRLIVDNGEVVTIDMGPVVQENNRNAAHSAQG